MPGITENTRGQDLPYNSLSAGRKKALAAGVTRKERVVHKEKIAEITPVFDKAIKTAEGNKKNFGAIGAKSPEEAQKILTGSTANNYVRWKKSGEPGKFVDFYRDRWAPIGVKNDPKNLNSNWNDNVRGSIKKQVGPEKYEQMKRENLVKAKVLGTGRA